MSDCVNPQEKNAVGHLSLMMKAIHADDRHQSAQHRSRNETWDSGKSMA